jgi:hypothetical protein
LENVETLSMKIDVQNKITVEVRSRSGMGRGVFATSAIPQGTLIDRCVTWELSAADRERLDQTSIGGHWFDHPEKPDSALLALGLLSVLNHSREPNAAIKWVKLSVGWIAEVEALTDIGSGDQILINYGMSDEELGFDVH